MEFKIIEEDYLDNHYTPHIIWLKTVVLVKHINDHEK